MVNKNRQQGGAALVLALLLVLLGAILSGGLLTMTISTNRAVVATENHTKAQYLAETAAKAGYRALQQDLDSFSQTPHSWTDLQGKIADLRSIFKIPNTVPDPAHPLESYKYELVLNLNPDVSDPSHGLYTISGEIVGTGTANGKTVKVHIPIQISSIAKVFNFAASAQSGVWLNGGVQVNGDLFAGSSVALHPFAHYTYGYPQVVQSTYPEINGQVAAGAIYAIPNETDRTDVGKHKLSNLTPVPADQLHNYLNGTFTLAEAGQVSLPSVDFDAMKTQVLRNNPDHYINSRHIRLFTWPYSDGFDPLYIGSNTTNGEGPYQGVWFIDGNLVIDGNINISGTLYVNGDVTIQNIHTKNPIAAVIVAQGSISVQNNNLYSSQPAILNAFLWTQQNDLVIYGVGSNLQINGGVIANNIILNGVRGNTGEGRSGLIFDNPQTLSKRPRLTINYDAQFLLKPPQGVPTIQGLQLRQTQPAFIER